MQGLEIEYATSTHDSGLFATRRRQCNVAWNPLWRSNRRDAQTQTSEDGLPSSEPKRTNVVCGFTFTLPSVRKLLSHLHLSSVPTHWFVELLMLMAMTMLVVLLTSCASSATNGLYLLSLTDNNSPVMSANSTSNLTATSPLEVRTGFFSICVLQAPSPWLCSSDTAILLRQFGGVTTDPAGVLQLSISFKNDIISSSMIIISLIFVCIAFLSRNRGRHVTDDLFQGEPEFSGYVIPYGGFYGTLTIQAICASTLASLLAIIWQHVTAVSTTAIVRSMAGNRISGSIGLGAMILGWFTFGLLAVIVISLSTSIRISIRLVQAEESPVEE